MLRFLAILYCTLCLSVSYSQSLQEPDYHEQHRPQLHFSPRAHWMNDPNGLVFYKGIYHMFFQYYPDSSVWGPNYWGHATSTDLIRWKEIEPALAPDSLGLIASGSAVVDANNTSGFGNAKQTPLVAIYAYINQELEKQNKFGQYQAIAYSLDGGYQWTKYNKNPVVANPGIKDFRDPKVIWFPPTKKWIMTVATHDHVTYYSSPDLKKWAKESEFGQHIGSHADTWECPDLIPFTVDSKKLWVQLVSLGGGPNGGSATQYFVGNFNGSVFTPLDTLTRWVDYGPDNYAGVTWSNTGDRKIFLGWMSNWLYGQVVPTEKWRSAMTLPRDLYLTKANNNYILRSLPAKELEKLRTNSIVKTNFTAKPNGALFSKGNLLDSLAEINVTTNKVQSFSFQFSNNNGENLTVGYDENRNAFYIDRTQSGNVSFNQNFPKKAWAPRLSNNSNIRLKLIIDVASVELFADEGSTVMTAIFFPSTPYNQVALQSDKEITFKSLQYSPLKSIWR